MRMILVLVAVAAVWIPGVSRVDAETPEEKGLRIATEARERQKGFGNFTANMIMVLRNKRGEESTREVRIKVIEVENDGDRTIFVFDRPRDVKGTAFLVHAHKEEADDQWLYLPALKRVKRISSSNQSGSFMGSEFSYEDMGASEIEKYTYRHLGDEPCGDLTCDVIERFPTQEDSGYSRQVLWIDNTEQRTVRIEYYDRRESHLKTLMVDDYNLYLDQFWRAGRMAMTNHLTGKSTDLNWADYAFGTDLDLNDFTQTALKRTR